MENQTQLELLKLSVELTNSLLTHKTISLGASQFPLQDGFDISKNSVVVVQTAVFNHLSSLINAE